MTLCQTFFYHISTHARQIFSGRNLLFHLLAIILTAILVVTGVDWWYWLTFKESLVRTLLLPGIIIGFFVPVFAVVITYLVGWLQKNNQLKLTAGGLGQAAFLGWTVSAFYKALTGRVPPVFRAVAPLTDISHQFRFGLLRGGVFWGWPSSHTTVAFSIAVALICMYPKNKVLKVLVLVYAFYVGLGVSMSIHWFSEFVAGAIFGTVVGVVVGTSYYKRLLTLR